MKAGPTIAIAALAGALAFVFADQVRDPGFERGHRGWVSAHTLAIAAKATPERGFVGHALSLAAPGERELYYFDRYPVFFSASLHGLLAATAPDKAAGVEAARQAMNLVHALTVTAAVLLLAALGVPVEAAVAAAALAACAHTMVEFRDMVHYDQPALLGMVLLLAAIAAWTRGRSQGLVLAATVVAMTAGRGYASLPLLGLWWLLEAVRTWRGRGHGGAAALQAILLGVPARACVLGAAVAAACLAWNVHQEALQRGVPWSEAGIVASAGKRLALDREFNVEKQARLDWTSVAKVQRQNLVRAVLPWSREEPLEDSPAIRAVLAALVLAGALAFAATRGGGAAIPWTLLVLAGPLWLLLMRNLAAFHPYTGLFLYPTALAFFAALLQAAGPRLRTPAALGACALLVACTGSRNEQLSRLRASALRDTADLQRIEEALGPGESFAVDGRVFRGVPFAPGFYLPDHDLVVQGRSPLLLTRERGRDGNLTPDNHGIFLVRSDEPRAARSRLARFVPSSKSAARRGARARERGGDGSR